MELEVIVIPVAEWYTWQQKHPLQRQMNFTPDVPLLRKELDWIDSEWERRMRSIPRDEYGRFVSGSRTPQPEPDIVWDQNVWLNPEFGTETTLCKTACCLAGNVAVQFATLVFVEGFTQLQCVLDDKGKAWDIWTYAANALGINDEEAKIFQALNKPRDIRRYAEMAAERVGEKL